MKDLLERADGDGEPGPPSSAGAAGRAGFVAEGSLFAEGSDAGISFKQIPLAPAFS